MKKLRVLFVQSLNSGVAFWRLYNPWVAMDRNNLAEARVLWWQKDLTDMHPWQTHIDQPEWMYRLTAEMGAYVQTADIVVIQGVYTPAALQTFYALKDMCSALGKPLITEMDDDITWTPAEHPASAAFTPGSGLVHTAISQIKHSDGLVVSTPWLKEVYTEHNSNISIIENAIDFKAWKHKSGSKPGIRIGWAGGASHGADLKPLAPVIKRILENHKGVKFVFVHYCPDEIRAIPGVEVINKWARIDHYPKFLAALDFDIWMAPLADNLFNRCKSNLRWLEGSALGIPTVASKVGHFAETIKHGVDGYLAENNEQFEAYLTRLIENSTHRRAMGMRAQDRVRRDFNIDSVAGKYVQALNDFILKGKTIDAPEIPESRHEAAMKCLSLKVETDELVEGPTVGDL